MSEQEMKGKTVFRYYKTKNGYAAALASPETDETVIFPSQTEGEPIVALAPVACLRSSTVKRIEIPEGVERIESALQGCKNLASLHLPNSLKEASPYLFLGCDALSLITAPQGSHLEALLSEALNLLPKTVLSLSGTPSKEIKEEQSTLLYTASETEGALDVLYQSKLSLEAKPYSKEEAKALLAEAEGYSLILTETKTYDVYSSDGVDKNDVDTSQKALPIGLDSLIVYKGRLYGFLYEGLGLSGALLLDGRALGRLTESDRVLCYGHPLDYYINTSRNLKLEKK